jgi:hypothetical protein
MSLPAAISATTRNTGQSLLNVGCGTGYFARRVARGRREPPKLYYHHAYLPGRLLPFPVTCAAERLDSPTELRYDNHPVHSQ